ncbi:uncharacterized protein LOC131858627 [Cryptomeria japonica]|uniref:uncharacterized protein LOC131858627 n=1 Tax=Cryptomeria japonica TaxID=3369 RepID=UPI0027DA1F84|nr:uncharacterized protein LOC131858627 [Cryptomeria japonica]
MKRIKNVEPVKEKSEEQIVEPSTTMTKATVPDKGNKIVVEDDLSHGVVDLSTLSPLQALKLATLALIKASEDLLKSVSEEKDELRKYNTTGASGSSGGRGGGAVGKQQPGKPVAKRGDGQRGNREVATARRSRRGPGAGSGREEPTVGVGKGSRWGPEGPPAGAAKAGLTGLTSLSVRYPASGGRPEKRVGEPERRPGIERQGPGRRPQDEWQAGAAGRRRRKAVGVGSSGGRGGGAVGKRWPGKPAAECSSGRRGSREATAARRSRQGPGAGRGREEPTAGAGKGSRWGPEGPPAGAAEAGLTGLTGLSIWYPAADESHVQQRGLAKGVDLAFTSANRICIES